MDKCYKCKKWFFFTNVLSNGLCKNCNKIKTKKEEDIDTLNKKIEKLIEKESLLEEKLRKKILEINDVNFIDKKREVKLRKITSLYNALLNGKNRDINKVEDLISEFKDIQLLVPSVNLKLNCMDVKELKKKMLENKEHVQNVLDSYHQRYTSSANITIYSLMVIGLEAELQNALYNLKYEKLENSIENIKKITKKYELIAINGSKNIVNTIKGFIGEIEYLFIEAVKIEYEYYVKKERIKEEQRVLREQMKQEAIERKALEESKRKIEKEELKFLSEIEQIKELINLETDDVKIKQLEERAEKVEIQLQEVEKNKEAIVNLQNGKAGYIYIISNLGSFGENVFKIGMTRRLDPQDRIDELGSASVPFRFDVHSFIFSENAPELENSIHKKLHLKRLNKVNLRKEFFQCSLSEVESLVYELEPSAVFNRTMLAEQFKQGLSMTDIPENFIEDINDNED